MRLLLVRHGQTPSNVQGLLDTALPGPGLTALGARQAAAIPDVLEDRAIDGIAVSTLVRTHQTASPLAELRGLEPVELDGFREVDGGDWEGTDDHDTHMRYLETVFSWAGGDLSRRVPGGPDGRDFLGRFDDAVAQVVDSGWETAVVVSHGAAIRSWACARAAGVDVATMAHSPLANTGLVEVEGGPTSGWTLRQVVADPLGGRRLLPSRADDPTGESVGEIEERAEESA
ncbi:histidine phosphatase family protein [Cellulosimicrobium arenosum]|uniref:Histidine phosphatase family protein n=1 Tax=Cellulosimicrobium arenosum TaxID=2708133 RepID=A0A927J127_9MICO|nr:histidine phosphatase family protein [Cellulosimicrobium arenosum]MBD8079941.1 histidine phosphatase family protein [Cellulosimicrobium arenosum]